MVTQKGNRHHEGNQAQAVVLDKTEKLPFVVSLKHLLEVADGVLEHVDVPFGSRPTPEDGKELVFVV